MRFGNRLVIIWIYKYYVKDKDVIERIVKILDKMAEINS